MSGDERHLGRTMSFGIPDVALGLVMGCVEDPWDRDAISLVCRHWCKVDALSRKHVTIAMAYSTTPDRLFRRFPCLESPAQAPSPAPPCSTSSPRTGAATPRPGSASSPPPSSSSRCCISAG
ncbi:hypothetical protein ZWY2020_008140 [Hordeum vulgare]|nr:hypothetical protein ZWY2020_008140 [Hordeum vulgare]